jgi:4-hydroxybenzoate polyprenyltransferase
MARRSAEVPAAPDGSLRTVVGGLAAACHPGPVIVVTSIATLLAAAAHAPATTIALVGLAFLSGQLSVGWSNDWIDAARDTAVGRLDKPVVSGSVSARAVRNAALAAAAATVPFSLLLGLRAGLAHLAAEGAAWAYNAGLKSTAWSWAPYATAFGLLPAVVVLALPGHPWPPAWVVGAGALLGVGAHLLNVLPDLDDDRSTGVRGFPHRLGRTWSGVGAPVVLVVASVLVVGGPAGRVSTAGLLVLGLVVVAAAVGAGAAVTGRRRIALAATAIVAVADIALLVLSGDSLSS